MPNSSAGPAGSRRDPSDAIYITKSRACGGQPPGHLMRASRPSWPFTLSSDRKEDQRLMVAGTTQVGQEPPLGDVCFARRLNIHTSIPARSSAEGLGRRRGKGWARSAHLTARGSHASAAPRQTNWITAEGDMMLLRIDSVSRLRAQQGTMDGANAEQKQLSPSVGFLVEASDGSRSCAAEPALRRLTLSLSSLAKPDGRAAPTPLSGPRYRGRSAVVRRAGPEQCRQGLVRHDLLTRLCARVLRER